MEKDKINILEHKVFKKPIPKMPRIVVGILLLVVAALASTSYFLWRDRINIISASDQKIRQFYVNLADSEIGFTDSSEFVLPIDRKFEDEVASYIARKESFIEIDLSQMKVSLYKEGGLLKTLPVLSKGRDGSWWETPTGNYKILSKEQNHFSSIGNVWMPWSMQFYGNFFIHGWPYYEDGTPVSSTYSGGCIRLETTDAERLYPLVSTGTPVIVIKDETRDS